MISNAKAYPNRHIFICHPSKIESPNLIILPQIQRTLTTFPCTVNRWFHGTICRIGLYRNWHCTIHITTS
uniref:Uncharacterized protein n=1 Tax=Setaria viridis TaxID=4556 RepID=A0A4U6WHK2_SETVI|nr:hypothetical protein SEVIR_1G266700v2 [Setaria viridis]